MKYTKEQRLDIGRRIYDGELSLRQAMKEYGICYSAAQNYLKYYRDENQLPVRPIKRSDGKESVLTLKSCEPRALEDYKEMSKDELIEELIKSRIREARLKKGYEVKGDGSVILYDNKNIK